MYQLIVVNDRTMEHRALEAYMEWDYLGFNIAGKFESMDKVKDFLEHRTVDAVLTFMSPYERLGVEVTCFIRDNYPHVKVVMVGEYKAYDYICDAMRYGACEYLAKPVEREELYHAFERVRNMLDVARLADRSEQLLPFSLCESEAAAGIQELSIHLVSSVVEGRTKEILSLNEQWFRELHATPVSFRFLCLYQLFERLYDRYHMMGIQLSPQLQRAEVFANLSWVDISALPEYCGKLLMDFSCYLFDKKISTDDTMIDRAKRYIEENLAVDFSMEEVAKSVFLSFSYFSREFKAQTGENVVNYVIRRRMEVAIELVRTEKYTVQEICAQVGYKDVKYFHRAFKKFTGYTVKEYQKLTNQTF